jgi:hypothetical protein
MGTKTYHFRRRTNATSYDPYDCLTTTLYPTSGDASSFKEEEYWSNGNTVHFSTMSNASTTDLNIHLPSISTATTTNTNPTRNYNSHHSDNYAVAEMKNENTATKQPILIENRDNEVRNSIFAGSVAGVTSCSIFHPFDVVRTKMQSTMKILETSSSGRSGGGTGATSTTVFNPKAAVRSGGGITSSSGPWAVMSHTYMNGGLRAFYTGISLPIVAQALYKSTVLTTNLVASNLVIDWKTKTQRKTGIFSTYELTLADRYVCGSVSGAVNAVLFVSPVEFVRNQLIQQHTNRSQRGQKASTDVKAMKGPFDVIRKTVQTNGLFGLWRGAGVTVVRDSIGCGVFFIMNEIGRKNIVHLTGHEEGALTNTVGAGMLAGFGYWLVSLPLDALKTLVQTGRSSSAIDTVSVLIRRDGGIGAVRQLYRGWQLAFGRGSPSAAVTMSTYSVVYNFCGRALP